MPHSTKDICGDPCDVCKVGRAHVVDIASRQRFFFGCDASTKDKPCKGSKSWQSVDVPQALRVLPEWAKGNEEVEPEKKSSKKSARPDNRGPNSDEIKEENSLSSKKVKTEIKTEK